jgi:hypothetical protein
MKILKKARAGFRIPIFRELLRRKTSLTVVEFLYVACPVFGFPV